MAHIETQPTALDRLIGKEEQGQTEDDIDLVDPTADETLEEVELYRSLFAEILVLGSTLQHLDGQERATFERRSHTGERQGDVIAAVVKEERNQIRDIEEQRTATMVGPDGLTGLTRMLYRQHAKKLRRVYTVA